MRNDRSLRYNHYHVDIPVDAGVEIMPYIHKAARKGAETHPVSCGELNYAITVLVLRYLGDSPNYQRYNDAIGALEAAKLELYRRRVSHYEDQKLLENGDVYL